MAHFYDKRNVLEQVHNVNTSTNNQFLMIELLLELVEKCKLIFKHKNWKDNILNINFLIN